MSSPQQWTAEGSVNIPLLINFDLPGDGESAIITLLDGTGSKLAQFGISVKKGMDPAITAVCKTAVVLEKGSFFAGCLATGVVGACMFPPMAALGGAFCTSSMIYALNGGAKDCVKGIAGELAVKLGEKKAFDFYQDSTLTPADLIPRAIEKMCEAWENSQPPKAPSRLRVIKHQE